MNLSLYKVADEYVISCNELFESVGDELSYDDIKDTLDSLSGDVEKKSLNVAGYYKNLQKELDAMKAYEKEIKARISVVENQSKRLKEYLKYNMERCEIKKISGPEFSISIRKCPASVVIDNADYIQRKYILKTEIHYDKKKIRKDLRSDIDVDGAHLQYSTSLVIT